jgi:hypothetical protein
MVLVALMVQEEVGIALSNVTGNIKDIRGCVEFNMDSSRSMRNPIVVKKGSIRHGKISVSKVKNQEWLKV